MGLLDIFKRKEPEQPQLQPEPEKEVAQMTTHAMNRIAAASERRKNFDLREIVDSLQQGKTAFVSVSEEGRQKDYVATYDTKSHQIDTNKPVIPIEALKEEEQKVIVEQVFGKDAEKEGIIKALHSATKIKVARFADEPVNEVKIYAKNIGEPAEISTYNSDEKLLRLTDVDYNGDNTVYAKVLCQQLYEDTAEYKQHSPTTIQALGETVEYNGKSHNLGDFSASQRLDMRQASGMNMREALIEETSRAPYYTAYKEAESKNYSITDCVQDISKITDSVSELKESLVFAGDVVKEIAKFDKAISNSELANNPDVKQSQAAVNEAYTVAAEKDQMNYAEQKYQMSMSEIIEKRNEANIAGLAADIQKHFENAAEMSKSNQKEAGIVQNNEIEIDM